MPIRLSKKQLIERAALVEKLNTSKSKIDDEVNDINEAMRLRFVTVEDLIGEYNQLLAEASAFVETIKDDAQSEFDDKSEGWQDGERGEAASNWIGEWDISFNDVETTDAPSIEIEIQDDGAVLEGLPEEPDA